MCTHSICFHIEVREIPILLLREIPILLVREIPILLVREIPILFGWKKSLVWGNMCLCHNVLSLTALSCD